jgi:sec-independent protein translocase protein TatA
VFRQFGPWEIGLIVLIILIFFGVGKLPQVGGAVGKAWRSFRKTQSGEEDEAETAKKPAETDKDKH